MGDQPGWGRRRWGPGSLSEASALLSRESGRGLLGTPPAPQARICEGQSQERILVLGYLSSPFLFHFMAGETESQKA